MSRFNATVKGCRSAFVSKVKAKVNSPHVIKKEKEPIIMTPGRIVGMTTRTMVPMMPSPSSRAASSTSLGNCLKKGRSMMIANGSVPVTSAKMIEGRVLTIPA